MTFKTWIKGLFTGPPKKPNPGQRGITRAVAKQHQSDHTKAMTERPVGRAKKKKHADRFKLKSGSKRAK